MGIGTYKERTLHAVLKKRFDADVTHHEIKCGGFITDILNEDGIIEIQTGTFRNLTKKLGVFLAERKVTVVYPSVRKKWLNWVGENGEVVSRRKSPKEGVIYQILGELYGICDYIGNKNFTLCIIPVDVDDFRLLNGWSRDKKKGSVRSERIPLEFSEPLYLKETGDYKSLVPVSLPDEFSLSELAKASGISKFSAGGGLKTLRTIGIISFSRMRGREKLYRRNF